MKDGAGDKRTKAYLEHGMISEEVTFFNKFVEGVDADEVEHYLARLKEFSEKYIVKHFRFEEEELFPQILKYGSEQEKKIVPVLLEEHEQIFTKLNQLMEQIDAYGADPAEQQIEKIMLSSREFLEMVLMHARKEDAYLSLNR